MKRKSQKIAFCGVMGAVMLCLMLLGNVIPVATYAVPCLCSILMMIVLTECGKTWCFTLYAAVSLVALTAIIDKELSLFYVLLLGYYPMVKIHIDKLKSSIVKWVIKMGMFFTACGAIYLLLLVVFPLGDLISEFSDMSAALIAALAILGAITFVALDIAIDKVNYIYLNKLRPKLIRSGKN